MRNVKNSSEVMETTSFIILIVLKRSTQSLLRRGEFMYSVNVFRALGILVRHECH